MEATEGRESREEQTELSLLWSRREAIEGFKRIYQAAIDGARVEVRDGNGEVVEVKYNPSAANAATKALEALNRLLGYDDPPEDSGERDFTVDFGECESYSE